MIEKIKKLFKKNWKYLFGIVSISITKELNFSNMLLDSIMWFLFWICLFIFFEWKHWVKSKWV